MELMPSNVVFVADTHRYLLGHFDLQGITSTLIPALFGDYTEDIPEDILQRAAERGTAIHEEIARIDEGISFATTYEETEYVRLRDEYGLIPVASEYIVTDVKHFASPIDKVYEGDIIADIKTTSELHYEQVTFQLSWYATYYQAMNKRAVSKAYVIWLPKEQYGKCKIEEIQLVAPATIKKIVKAYLDGEDIAQYAPLFKRQENTLPAPVEDALSGVLAREEKIKTLEEELKQLKTLREEFNKIAIEYFIQSGAKNIERDGLLISYIAPTIRTSVDSKALKADHPDIFEEYKRETVVSENVRITLRK